MGGGLLTTAEFARVFYTEPRLVRRAIWKRPELMGGALKFRNRWVIRASTAHKLLDYLDHEEDRAARLGWAYMLLGFPDPDFWDSPNVVLDYPTLHRRVDYLSECGCGKGITDDVDVETERFNYLYEPGKTPPVAPFSPEYLEGAMNE